MVKRKNKRGDTLIEVMLAIGIFSMVAIAVVAVMNSGTSDAQTALETTLAREEIDAQAEALRFIHNAYVADKHSEIGDLWKIITEEKAITEETEISKVAKYSPESCSSLYDETTGEAKLHGFIIDTQRFIIRNKSYLSQASTYPHLVFSGTNNLINSPGSTIYRAEGIYIIAVKDPKSTNIVGKNKTSAYYDFYIRTCWYGTSDQSPSTISTVMRLYDPTIIKK